MLFTIHCTFRPGAFAKAKSLRLEHYQFLKEVRETIHQGGPLLSSEGIPQGMLMIIERESFEAAQAFIATEPYNHAGFFESVAIRHWSPVIPEPTPGFIDAEFENERVARESQNMLS